ncbi:MAG: 50S ribosomal protein L22 [Deltaproteobacteria bacterium]|nr:MAG: 50S ribosomal protein L22 [Deltaproteobacteria bacterium]
MATAKLRYVRIAPRKLRVLADMVRGKPVARAIEELRFTQRSGARPLFKLLVSAVANAEQAAGDVDLDRLYVRRITVDQGPILKRWRPRAMGRATRINKKTSHVFVELAERT